MIGIIANYFQKKKRQFFWFDRKSKFKTFFFLIDSNLSIEPNHNNFFECEADFN